MRQRGARGGALPWRRALLPAALTVLGACAGTPREVHEPRAYPETKLAASSVALQVIDHRPAPVDPQRRQLLLPADFEAEALRRLTQMLAGQGPALHVTALVNAGDAADLTDSRGELTRVSVALGFEVKVVGGPLLRRSEAQSTADLHRDEVTPEELALLLRSTSLDAFDRYWASAQTTAALNQDLAAFERRPTEAAAPAQP